MSHSITNRTVILITMLFIIIIPYTEIMLVCHFKLLLSPTTAPSICPQRMVFANHIAIMYTQYVNAKS